MELFTLDQNNWNGFSGRYSNFRSWSLLFHLLAPSQWCWLEAERLDALKSHSLSIVSGLVVGLATTFLHEI